MEPKWMVRKCKKPSTRWVAWRMRQKKKTGKIFDGWEKAIIYATYMYKLDRIMEQL